MSFLERALEFIAGERATLIECATLNGDVETMDARERAYLVELDELLALGVCFGGRSRSRASQARRPGAPVKMRRMDG